MEDKEKNVYTEKEEYEGKMLSAKFDILKPEDQQKLFWIIKGIQIARENVNIS